MLTVRCFSVFVTVGAHSAVMLSLVLVFARGSSQTPQHRRIAITSITAIAINGVSVAADLLPFAIFGGKELSFAALASRTLDAFVNAVSICAVRPSFLPSFYPKTNTLKLLFSRPFS